MTRDEIIYWRDKYDRDEDQYNTGLEEKLRKKFRARGCAAKSDIEEIIGWKFQGRLTGRRNLNLARITDLDEWVIESITKLAFQVDSDRLKLKLLTATDGIWLSVASVILAFHDPERYGVLDFRMAWTCRNREEDIHREGLSEVFRAGKRKIYRRWPSVQGR